MGAFLCGAWQPLHPYSGVKHPPLGDFYDRFDYGQHGRDLAGITPAYPLLHWGRVSRGDCRGRSILQTINRTDQATIRERVGRWRE